MAIKYKKNPTVESTYVPLDELDYEEIVELPRESFTQEEFDSLDEYVQSTIHINDPQSAKRINDIVQDITNRIDWINEGNIDESTDYFADGIKYASKQPDFLDTVPDEDGSIEDLINKYGPILGVPRVERALLYYLDDADYYDKSHDDYYYPSRSGYFQIPIDRDFYIGSGDIRGLNDAYPDEIVAALVEIENIRPYMVEELGLTLEILLGIRNEGNDFLTAPATTESYAFTPQWETIVERIEDELNDEMPDEPLKTSDRRTYEERKIYTFKDGAYWVELTTEDLPDETLALGHCVGNLEHGYPQAVQSGEVVIYSLRTTSGRSKLTAAFELDDEGDAYKIRDLKGKANRLAGWAGGSEGKDRGKVKWMEVQKVGKLLELLGLSTDQPALDAAHKAMEELGGEAAKWTQNPAWHCPFCKESR